MPEKREGELISIGDLIKGSGLRGPTPTQLRLLEAVAAEELDTLYQHSVLCQTCLPYRNPGNDVRVWDRVQGGAHLRIKAGEIMDPKLGRLVDVGLPFGPKSRIILMHINQRAVLTQSPIVEVGETFTGFVRNVLGLAPDGRTTPVVKDQLARLSSAEIVLGVATEKLGVTRATRIVSEIEVWLTKDERQRVLWPERINLSHEYFLSLIENAVPLDERHIRALAHNCMALDIYTWLTHRLHRIPAGKPQRISWLSLWSQFGQNYKIENIRKFRYDFRSALNQVLTLYKDAKVVDDVQKRPKIHQRGGELMWRSDYAEGLMLFHSLPPVLKRPPKSTT